MPDKFHPDDLKNPLYEHDQVITIHELLAIYNGLAAQYEATHWWKFKLRHGLNISGHIVYELITWLRQGKPVLANPGDIK